MLPRIFLISLLILSAFIIYEDWISTPSCKIVARSSSTGTDSDPNIDSDDDLKVMMVANLLLLGSEAGFVDKYFTDYYMSKFFRKSFGSLMPDMLIVLGDVSARGCEMARSGWNSVLRQFQMVIGPFFELPLHVVLGDRDVGECSRLNRESVDRVASKLLGLDSAGSGAFKIGNISFLSLNAVALLCGSNDLRLSTEKTIERERSDIQMEVGDVAKMKYESSSVSVASDGFPWRGNDISAGSGPVVLLHFPLYRTEDSCRKDGNVAGAISTVNGKLKAIVGRDVTGAGPYELLHHLPGNATEYIFQALKPRIIFSSHTHEFCSHTHPDGTLEITVPAFSWNARDDPGFVLATFKNIGNLITISQCSLAKADHILATIVSSFILILSLALCANRSLLLIMPSPRPRQYTTTPENPHAH